jgi:hypothetical protein
LFQRRVTFLVGHFGSGKTEIALNGALGLAAHGAAVTLADLDVVKPYFRSRAARNLLAEAGIELLVPEGENIFADLPIIVPQIRGALGRTGTKVIFDVGGDDTGARVLGSLADVVPHDETDCLLVLNFRRPATGDPDEAVAMVRRIEAVARIQVNGLISNTHLMDETTDEVILEGHRMAVETGRNLDIPVVAVAVPEGSLNDFDLTQLDCELIQLQRLLKPPFAFSTPGRRAIGPLFVLN